MMDGHKTQLHSWQEIIEILHEQGKHKEASAVELALKEGKKIKAIQLIKASGLSLEKG